MPRISSYTPAWLSRPSPGFDFFNKTSASPPKSFNGSASGSANGEMSRLIAHRGTQIFTVVDNELRWSDLVLLKEQWEIQRNSQRGRADSSTDFGDEDSQKLPYRVLKIPVSRKIRQIVISPTEEYLAIITLYTAHIAVLPDASHLFSQDRTDLKLKAFQLGPTIHVMERSPIAAVLWHPLGVQGSAFITITADAVVRLWELDRKNRWSFDMPPLDFDLRKLADGQSAAEDFSPSKYGTNKGFSPDSFEMEVASASFGGTGRQGEAPWSSTTLWVAMKAGDIYALCPLLPSKWEAPPSLTASLAVSIQCRAAALGGKEHVSKYARKISDQQLGWIAEIEKQQHRAGDAAIQRPSYPGSIPKLQGPFRLAPDPDQIFDIADIHVSSPIMMESSLENATDSPSDLLSSSFDLVCLATGDAKIHLCINLEIVEGSWLPAKKSSRLLEGESTTEDSPELLVIESIRLLNAPQSCWPVITSDAQSQDSIFISHNYGVSHVDLTPLTGNLLEELNDNAESGVDFRVGMLVENSRFHVDHPIDLRKKLERDEGSASENTTCIDLSDPELGHFLLTVVAGQPHAVTLDDAVDDRTPYGNNSDYSAEAEIQGLLSHETRPAYQPPEEFWAPSTLTSFMEQHVHSRGRRFMSEEVRFSPTTLNLLMEAHRVLSHETHRLGVAAADLFSRCERLQDEFKEQLVRAREAAERVDAVLGDDADPYQEESGNSLGLSPLEITERLDLVKAQHETLTARYDELRRKVNSLNGRSLNDKERAWMAEVASMDELVAPPAPSSSLTDSPNTRQDDEAGTTPAARFEHVKKLKEPLLAHVQEIEQDASAAAATEAEQPPGLFNIAPDRRRARLAEVNGMLERQSALVEATKAKLERLDAMSL